MPRAYSRERDTTQKEEKRGSFDCVRRAIEAFRACICRSRVRTRALCSAHWKKISDDRLYPCSSKKKYCWCELTLIEHTRSKTKTSAPPHVTRDRRELWINPRMAARRDSPFPAIRTPFRHALYFCTCKSRIMSSCLNGPAVISSVSRCYRLWG